MSRQLALSSALSVMAMVAVALVATVTPADLAQPGGAMVQVQLLHAAPLVLAPAQ